MSVTSRRRTSVSSAALRCSALLLFQIFQTTLCAAEPPASADAEPPPALVADAPAPTQPALLQPAPPPPEEPPPSGEPAASAELAAEELVAQSVASFKQERFMAAAQAMEAAFALRPRPIYVFNAAQAYRRAGRPREAIAAYQRFLTLAPDAPQVSEANGHIKNMEQLLAAEARANAETQNRRALAVTTARTQADLLITRVRAADERRRARRRAGIIGGAVGAVALGLAVALPLLLTREPTTDWGFHMVTF